MVQKYLAILTNSHFPFQLSTYISSGSEQKQLVSIKQMDCIPVSHEFPWALVGAVFWASGLVLGYCGIVCGFQDSLNHLLVILNAWKEMMDQTLVEVF